MGRPQEAQVWHGLSPPSASSGGRGGKEILASAAVWVHPCQALFPLLDEVAKKLTFLINTREDWPYAFMWLCKDSWHVPLSNMLGTSASW